MRKYLGRGKLYIKRLLGQDGTRLNKELLKHQLAIGENLPIVRIAVAGAGKFARKHLEVLSYIPNVEVVGVSNRGNSDISHFRSEYGVERTFSDFYDMLDQTDPDGVFIVVSHFETVKVASACLKKGIPCFIEKPAGFTSEETASLAKLASKHNCLNMVGLNRRFVSVIHNALTRVIQRGPLTGIIIDAPEAIRRIRDRERLDPRLYDLWLVANNIHAIDLFRCLGGEVEEIHSYKESREEREGDSFTSILRLSNNCLGTYISHWNSAGGWNLTLYGEGIKTEISLSNYKAAIYQDRTRFSIPLNPIDIKFKPGLYVQNQTFINALALGEKLPYPASDLDDSTKTMRLIERIMLKNEKRE